MTRKDYVAIAAVIRPRMMEALESMESDPTPYAFGQITEARCMARAIADCLAEDNPRFDRARFLSACGLDTRSAMTQEAKTFLNSGGITNGH